MKDLYLLIKGASLSMVSAQIFCTQCGAANIAGGKFCYACGQAIQAPTNGGANTLGVGALLKQRYRIAQQIGSGGFGAVYRAADIDLGQRLVAVKEMSQHNLSSQEIARATQAFKQEALLLADLMHEHLPRIYDHFTEGGHWYLVMDYIRGETLEEYLTDAPQKCLALEEALRIGLQLCSVLDYLHRRQPPIIFRDLKPANVILTPEGQIFLIDFGIARHFKPGQARDTIAFGSPGYAPPEQYGRAQTTPRADIYSLGAILHQMLSGTDPSLTPFRFAPLSPAMPALQALLTRMLDMDEHRRPASMAEVKRELQHIQAQPFAPVVVAPQASPAMAAKRVRNLHFTQPASGPCSLILEGHSSPVHTVAWSSKGIQIASASEEIVRIWDMQQGRELCSYQEHLAPIVTMAWSPRQTQIASLSQDNNLRIWSSSTGSTISVNPGGPLPPGGAMRLLSWSPDGRWLAVAGDQRAIEIIDVGAQSHLPALQGRGSQGYTTLDWSPGGQRLACTSENTVYLWDMSTRVLLLTYDHSARLRAVDWAPNNIYIASCGYGKIIQIWDTRNKDLLVLCSGDKLEQINTLSWSPDSRLLASGDDAGHVQIWHARTGEKSRMYSDHTDAVLTSAWSSNGLYLASGSSDLTVRIWSTL